MTLCAAALAFGALAAHVTRGSDAPSGATQSRPPKRAVLPSMRKNAPVLASAAHPVAPEPDEPALPELPPRPDDPFAERMKDGLVITGATEHRLVLFTFDDGPDERYTPALLDELDEIGVKAVFFLLANRIRGENNWERRQAELAREIVRRGHTIGSHTMDHPQLPSLDNEGVARELAAAEAVFERVLGARPWLLRPPGGARSPRTDEIVERRGYTTMTWNLGAGDFQVRTADDVVTTFMKVFERRERDDGHKGGIVLLHDTYPWTVEAVPRIVAELRRRNCELLERGEELYDIVDDPALFFAPRAGEPHGTVAGPAEPPRAILEARQARLRAEAAARCGR